MNRASSRLRGLFATLALVGFVVGVPVVLVAIDALPDPSAFTWSRLTSQDDGTLALQVITGVCWVAWAVFTCQLIASIVSQVRGIRTPRLPGLAVPQLAADRSGRRCGAAVRRGCRPSVPCCPNPARTRRSRRRCPRRPRLP